MNWIQQRAQQDANRRSAAPRIWSHFCAALRSAVESYARLYGQAPSAVAVRFDETQYDSATLQVERKEGSVVFNIRFDKESCVIVISVDGKERKLHIHFDPENPEAVLRNADGVLTLEAASRIVLEPILFPDH
jgi:hypothetical protein